MSILTLIRKVITFKGKSAYPLKKTGAKDFILSMLICFIEVKPKICIRRKKAIGGTRDMNMENGNKNKLDTKETNLGVYKRNKRKNET